VRGVNGTHPSRGGPHVVPPPPPPPPPSSPHPPRRPGAGLLRARRTVDRVRRAGGLRPVRHARGELGATPADVAQPVAPAPTGGDTPADFPGASRAPQYQAPRTISIVRSERTVVRDVDQALPIVLSIAALLLALGGLGIALARTGVVRRRLANHTH